MRAKVGSGPAFTSGDGHACAHVDIIWDNPRNAVVLLFSATIHDCDNASM